MSLTNHTIAQSDLHEFQAYLRDQLEERRRDQTHGRPPRPPGPALTIAFETGSGAREIARRVATLLQAADPGDPSPWSVFDRQLVERMLEDHHLPKRLAKLIPEDRRSYIDDVLDELAGLRPPSWVLVPKMAETILNLAEAGHVILMGHGASLTTATVANVFHVRLIGSLPTRIKRVQETEHLSSEAAAKFITRSDRGRRRFSKTHLHGDVRDDLHYHLVVNTDRISPPEAAELIVAAARASFSRSMAIA